MCDNDVILSAFLRKKSIIGWLVGKKCVPLQSKGKKLCTILLIIYIYIPFM